MTLYENFNKKLFLLQKIEDLHLRFDALSEFLLYFEFQYIGSEANHIIEIAKNYIEYTETQLNNQIKNQDTSTKYKYHVTTAQNLNFTSPSAVSQMISDISNLQDARDRNREYKVLFPFCIELSDMKDIKMRIKDTDRLIQKYELSKKTFESDFHYSILENNFSNEVKLQQLLDSLNANKQITFDNKIKFYNHKLAYILQVIQKIEVININYFDEPCTLEIAPYYETYKKAFNEGVRCYNEEYSHFKTAYYQNPDLVINTLRKKYFRQTISSIDYWGKVNIFNNIFNHNSIKDLGYKAGHVSQLMDFISKHGINDFYSIFDNPKDIIDSNEALTIFIKLLSEKTELSFRYDVLLKELKLRNTDQLIGIERLLFYYSEFLNEMAISKKRFLENNTNQSFEFNVFINDARNLCYNFTTDNIAELTEFFEFAKNKIKDSPSKDNLKNNNNIVNIQTCAYAIEKIDNYITVLDYNLKHKSDLSTLFFYNTFKDKFSLLKTELNIFFIDYDDSKRNKCIEACISMLKVTENSFISNQISDAKSVLKQCKLSLNDFFEHSEFNKNYIHEFQGFCSLTYEQIESKCDNHELLDYHKSFFALIFNHFISELIDFFNVLLENDESNILTNNIDSNDFSLYESIGFFEKEFQPMLNCNSIVKNIEIFSESISPVVIEFFPDSPSDWYYSILYKFNDLKRGISCYKIDCDKDKLGDCIDLCINIIKEYSDSLREEDYYDARNYFLDKKIDLNVFFQNDFFKKSIDNELMFMRDIQPSSLEFETLNIKNARIHVSLYHYTSYCFLNEFLSFLNNFLINDIPDSSDKQIIAGGKNGTIITSNDSLDEKNVIFYSIQEIHNYIHTAVSQIELFISNKISFLQYYELQNSFTQLLKFIHLPEKSSQHDLDLCIIYFKNLSNLEIKLSDKSVNSNIDNENKVFQRYLVEIEKSKIIVGQILDDFNLLEDNDGDSILDISTNDSDLHFPSTNISSNSKQNKLDLTSNTNNDTFDNFFIDKQKKYILDLLEDLSITKDGKYCLTIRKKSAVRGVVEALRDHNIIPDIGLQNLCRVIAVKISLDLPSNLDCSNTSNKYLALAIRHIKNNPLS